jgi:predicted transcriptional regulator
MECLQGLDKLFFELASESRLSILCELQAGGLRMQEIARRLKITDTETSRQLLRLSDASLIQKQPDGAYVVTQYGKLLLQLSRSFEFALKFKQCLLTRDIWRIPEPFINRIGELSQTNSAVGTIEVLNRMESLISQAEKFLLCIVDRPIHVINAEAVKKIRKGFVVKAIFDEQNLQNYQKIPETKGVLEKKVTNQIPATMLISEKAAAVNLVSIDTREDNALFYGADPTFLGWAKDLFDYYWERGKPFHMVPTS